MSRRRPGEPDGENIASPAWIVSPAALTRGHPAFGLWRGGLAAFGCLLVTSLLRSVSAAGQDWIDTDVVLDPSGWTTAAMTIAVAVFALEAGFVTAWFLRWRWCRPAWGRLTVLEACTALLPIVMAGWFGWSGTAPWAELWPIVLPESIAVAVGTGVRILFWVYLARSAAFRVTFESRVRAGDPILHRVDAADSGA